MRARAWNLALRQRHELRPILAGDAKLVLLQMRERLARKPFALAQISCRRVDEEQSGDELPAFAPLVHRAKRVQAVRRIVVALQLAQYDSVAVVELDFLRGPRLVVHGDFVAAGDEVGRVQHRMVLLDVVVTLRRALVVVEGHARADDIQYRRAAMRKSRFEQRNQLLAVAGKRPRHERRAQLDRETADFDRFEFVDLPFLEHRTAVRSRGKLPFRQAVTPLSSMMYVAS